MSATASPGRAIEYLKGYRVVREDPEWLSKVGVGAVLFLSTMCIPLVGQLALVGHQTLVLRRAVSGVDSPMPRLELSFDYLGKLVGLGFKAFIARFLWSIPLVAIAFALGMCAYLGLAAAIIGAASRQGEPDVGALGLVCVSAGSIFFVAAVLVLSIPAAIAAMRAELTDKLEAGLAFGEVMAFMRRQLRPLLVGTLVLSVVGGLLSIVGLLACYVGIFPIAVLGLSAHTHFMAQVYLRDVEQGGPTLTIGPLDVEPSSASAAPR